VDQGLKETDLPLLVRTPDEWAEVALGDTLALLNDHAYLEKKAAANALEMLNRWPEPMPPKMWITTLAGVARDETAHLAMVCKVLHRRGGRLEKVHKNPYANALRQLVRRGQGNCEIVDRLLISALIEVRSCERFEVLARVSTDAELVRLYHGLWASELSHYLLFLRLANRVLAPVEVSSRWQEFLQAEADILLAQPPGPRMHSGTLSRTSITL
jgi:tRNA-(ms[2]io[6]A)-hydroxylase